MTERDDKPEDKDSGESGAVRNYVDNGQPGSEFETREMPAVPDNEEEEEESASISGHVVSADKPGSTDETIVASKEDTEARNAAGADEGDESASIHGHFVSAEKPGSTDDTSVASKEDTEARKADKKFDPASVIDEEEEATAMVREGKPDPFDDLETREVPALSDDVRVRAAEAAASLGETAQVVGEWDESDGDASLAASVAAASGEMPLPREEEPAEIAGPIIEGARRAQAEWRKLRFEQRLEFFDNLRSELVTQRSDYVPSMATAIGRPMVEALTGEYLPVLEVLRTLEDIMPPLLVEQHAAGGPVTHEGISAEVRMVPFGVVLIANSHQSPFAIPMTLVIDALAAGNAVLFCGSEHHPRINEVIRRLFQRAGFPDNLLQVLGGDSDTVKTLIDVGPDKVFFEGAEDLATRIAVRCAESGCALQILRKVKDVLVVLKGADMQHALDAALSCAFASGGMRAAAVERIVIDNELYDEFRMLFMDAIRTMNSHHAQLANINDTFDPRRAQLLVEDAVAKGARVTYPAGEEPGRWIHWKAAVFEALPPKAKLSTERFEGPGCALYRAEDAADETSKILRVAPASNITILGKVDRAVRAKFEELPASRVSFNETLLLGSSSGGGVPVGPETPRSTTGPLSMLRAKVISSSEHTGSRIAWFPYTDDKAYALMDAMDAMYGLKAGKRIKAALKIAINPTVRRLLRGED